MKKLSVSGILLILSAVLLFTISSKAQNLTKANFSGVILPQFMGSGTGRLPVVYRATVSNLLPNATYRYFNQLAKYTDIGTTAGGAGNPMFMGSPFVYTTTTGFVTAGQYAEFTTDNSGSYTGWFCSVFTTNARFTAGNYVIPSITLNDGAGGTIAAARYAMNDSIKVMAFATTAGANNISGIYGTSSATGKNIILLYDNMKGTGKPLSCTYAEDEGIAVATVITFYSASVNGIAGAWGALIPNNNSNGLQRIEQRSLSNASVVGCATDDDGVWPTGSVSTVNPVSGTTALVISSTDAPLTGCEAVTNITSSMVSASQVKQGSKKVLLYNLNLNPAVQAVRLDTLKLITAGSYKATDINSFGFKLWLSTDAVFDTNDVLMDSAAASGPGTLIFDTPLSIAVNNFAYFFLTADISSTATLGDSIYIAATPFSNIILNSGTKTGTNPVPAAGAKLFISPNSPVLNAGTVASFGKVVANNTSSEHSFSIDGTNLFPANDTVKITVPSHFEISLTSGTGFTSSTIALPYTTGTLPATTIYVIFKPTAYQIYNGNISITGGGTSTSVSLNGTGISPDSFPPVPDTAFATSLTTIQVVFNEAVDTTAELLANYTGVGTINKATRNATLDTITLKLTTALSPGIPKTLTVKNIQDTSSNHNKMTASQNFMVKFGKVPQPPDYTISQIKGVNANGVADSVNVNCKLTGIISSLNYRAWKPGYQFILHDATGGINVYKADLPFASLPVAKMGYKVKVIGKVAQYNGLTEFLPDSIDFIDSNQTIMSPVLVTKFTESIESELIRVNNLTWIDTAAFPWPKAADLAKNIKATNGTDTFIIRIETECKLHGFWGYTGPDTTFDIIGLGWQFDNSSPYNSGYELYPRIESDLILHQPSSINESKTNSLNIYPNPNQGHFYLDNPSADKVQVRIVNNLGQEVYSGISQDRKIYIQLDVKAGIYFVQLKNLEKPENSSARILIR